ncbi:Cellulase [Heracleum sosnowskyi]|uniref:cellulase n=1 Tax=Heracleum sosnowskyi TaxID=360622 RepID=A0AAD8HUG7_9APIA|nr:Cellulase [Heracleum sosnowskyi]
MDYPRLVQMAYTAPELAGEMAVALAAASIVFRDNTAYSKKLIKGASIIFEFALDKNQRETYNANNLMTVLYYNSSGYYDEYMWGATWLYYATGNWSYLALATDQGLLHDISMHSDSRVLSWDNKLPVAMMLLIQYAEVIGAFDTLKLFLYCVKHDVSM